MTITINKLEIGTVKFEDITVPLTGYSYLPSRSGVKLDVPRQVTNGQNINGKGYYIYAQDMGIKILRIDPGQQYAIPGSMAQALMNLWDIPDPVAAPFVVVENYTTFDGTDKTWNKCIILEEPVFTPLEGVELRYFYNYKLVIGLLP